MPRDCELNGVMRHLRKFLMIFSVSLVISLSLVSLAAQNKIGAKGARAVVQTFFSLLKSQQYAALYDYLPSEFQQQLTREQLTQSLQRLDSFIAIERMEMGRIQEKGEFAVIETTIYGRLKKPMKFDGAEVTEGRVSVQQYLYKEKNQWKIATADNRIRDYFLKHHPQFNNQFELSSPKFEFKQNGQWVVPRPRFGTKP